jgi:DNA-binding MarR family transcriptional regulator
MAPSGNLFFLVTISEVRRQGLTYLAFYALQRTIEESEFSAYLLRRETGFEDYEVSRACAFLTRGGLVEMKKAETDRRVRVLTPTQRGRRLLEKVLSMAGRRLKDGVPAPGRLRRLEEAAGHLRQANRILLGPLQLSFFDTDLLEPDRPARTRRKKRVQAKPQSRRSKFPI